MQIVFARRKRFSFLTILALFIITKKNHKTNVTASIKIDNKSRKGDITMELLFEQCKHNQSEEPCDECSPKKEEEEKIDISEYDYHLRLWF
jgi:hypothetical protein